MNTAPRPCRSCWTCRGFGATRLMIFIIAIIALTAVIKSFSYAAHCYAGFTEQLAALGDDR